MSADTYVADTLTLPRLGETMEEGKVVGWTKAAGESFQRGETLVEVETDKTAVEVPALSDGVLDRIRADAGETVDVGGVLADIRVPPAAASGEAAGASRAEGHAGVAGGEPSPDVASRPASKPSAAPAGTGAATGAATDDRPVRPRASPVARRLARQHGLDVGELGGSGPRGRVTSADVRAAIGTATPAAAPAMPASGRASSAPGGAVDIGARLGLYTLREGSGTPLVLLHGFGADHGIWRGFAGRLATPAPVLGIDLPGHGAAHGHPARSVPEMVDALARELTDAGLSRVHLCGHSLGGALAAELAGGGLLDVRSLTLLAPAGLTPAIDGAFIDALCRCTREDSLRPWLRQLVHDPASLPDALVRALVAARQDAATTRAHRALADAVFPEGTQAVDIRLALARMGGPLKVIVGAADRIIPPSGTRGLPARAGVHTLPAVGHLPHLEDPETVASLLDEALRSAP